MGKILSQSEEPVVKDQREACSCVSELGWIWIERHPSNGPMTSCRLLCNKFCDWEVIVVSDHVISQCSQ